jgi:magnesium transporter
MTLLRRLADHALEDHPTRAATVLERLGEDEVVAVLETTTDERAREILPCLTPRLASAVLERLDLDVAVRILGALDVETLARMLRRLEGTRQGAILERLPPRHARSLARLLRFPANTAGALMDPEVLALPMELTAREALARVREAPEDARYNLYVLQRDRLVGALNLRELLIAPEEAGLADLMVRDPYRVLASDDRPTVLAHPGWRSVHALPVVDESGAYLGAIRYHTLRDLESELRAGQGGDTETSAAIGELIAAGARGLIDALGGVAPARARDRG